MARQNGQFTFHTPASNAALGDAASSTATRRIFTAIERCTVVEFGAMAEDSANVPSSAFAFKAFKRSGGNSANDITVDAFTAANAAEAGPVGNVKLVNGIVTNTLALLTAGKALRAYCEVTLDKGDQLVLAVTTSGGGASTVVFYAKVFADGAGIVEAADVDSN